MVEADLESDNVQYEVVAKEKKEHTNDAAPPYEYFDWTRKKNIYRMPYGKNGSTQTDECVGLSFLRLNKYNGALHL